LAHLAHFGAHRCTFYVSNLEQGQEIFSLAQNILGINLRNFVLKFSILMKGAKLNGV